MKDAVQFARDLADAYSTDRYNGGWKSVIEMLRKEYGWNDREVEAFIRSKHTRWAGDAANKGSHITVSDLRKYLEKYGSKKFWKSEVEFLLTETEAV